jgi:hypothetical protein
MKFELSILAVAAAVCTGAYFMKSAESAGMSSELSRETFKVSDKRHHFEYKLEQAETTTRGVLTMTGNQSGVSEGGAVKVLHYLTDKSVSEFKRTQHNGQCPAPFFNAHAKQRILIPATPAIENQLRQIDLPNYQKVATWRPFAASGYCIRSAPVIVKDGKEGRLPSNMFSNCLTMVVTRFELINQSVMAEAQAAK